MKDEEKVIFEKAIQNLEAAELIAQQGYNEIAVSRAYYTLFYIAEALLLRHGQHFSSHSAVIAAFGKEFAKSGVLDPKYHQYLIKAQEIRQTSDYSYTETIANESVVKVLQWGREFLEAAQKYLN
jgi:uncharacterized protein (UPF0332 family)